VLNYLGYSWVEMGINLTRARAMIESAVEQRPNDGYIVDSLGWVLYQLGSYEEAARFLERAAELRPSDPVILDHFGDGLWRVDRRAEARFQWQRALSFEPEESLADTIGEKLRTGLPAASDGGAGDQKDL
jgi:Flp pilus assembly protein TadD